MTMLGNNYRLTDFQCALGISQLKKVPAWTARRQEIARQYDAEFQNMNMLSPLKVRSTVSHAYHLYVIQLNLELLTKERNEIFQALRAENIGVNVHYVPVYLHPYYRERFGLKKGLCPNAERAYERMLSIPMFAKMTDGDAQDVIDALKKVTEAYTK
jgi:perosamine synthetase